MQRQCLWTDWNIDKLAQHDITPDEFEEALAAPLYYARSRSSDRPAVVAWVRGRKLFCVYNEIDDHMVLPRTAYEIS
jgi:hypothetical protein